MRWKLSDRTLLPCPIYTRPPCKFDFTHTPRRALKCWHTINLKIIYLCCMQWNFILKKCFNSGEEASMLVVYSPGCNQLKRLMKSRQVAEQLRLFSISGDWQKKPETFAKLFHTIGVNNFLRLFYWKSVRFPVLCSILIWVNTRLNVNILMYLSQAGVAGAPSRNQSWKEETSKSFERFWRPVFKTSGEVWQKLVLSFNSLWWCNV